jgi:hypothetical protein
LNIDFLPFNFVQCRDVRALTLQELYNSPYPLRVIFEVFNIP